MTKQAEQSLIEGNLQQQKDRKPPAIYVTLARHLKRTFGWQSGKW